MDGSRFRSTICIALLLSAFSANPGRSQTPRTVSTKEMKGEVTLKVYSLAEFGESEKLCQWIAQEIPNVVRPGTWNQNPGVMKYNPELFHVVVIRHTSEVHAEVDAYLKGLKKAATRKASDAAPQTAQADPNVLQAKFSETKALAKSEPSASSRYIIPTPAKQPKHLFHLILRFEGSGMDSALTELAKRLGGDADNSSDTARSDAGKLAQQLFEFIIRYEGEGIIDSSVVEFMRLQQKSESSAPVPPASGYFPSSPNSCPLAPTLTPPMCETVGPPAPLSKPTPAK